jgi:hypothetical protein
MNNIMCMYGFNPAPFAGIVEAAEATGICFFTLAEVELTLENQRKLYELHRACVADNPAYEGWDFPDFPPRNLQFTTLSSRLASRSCGRRALDWTSFARSLC